MVVKSIDASQPDDYQRIIRQASTVLDEGGLVVFPTETVYGIGARADRRQAMSRLRQVKKRGSEKPFTLHLGTRTDSQRYVPDQGKLARRFIRKGWPGPLTLVLTTHEPAATPAAQSLDSEALAALYHDGTVGLRCPDDRIASDLLCAVAGPVVAASANRATLPPPRTADEAVERLDGSVDLVLQGPPARYQKPSTILRIVGEEYELLRVGVLDERMIRKMNTVNLLFVCTGNTCRSPLAGAIAARMLADRIGCKPDDLSAHDVFVSTAGTSAFGPTPAADHVLDIAQSHGVNLTGHRARRLTVELIQQSDHVFTMTHSHRNAVLAMLPSAADKTQTLKPDGDIDDPIGGDRGVYDACATDIKEALEIRLADFEL